MKYGPDQLRDAVLRHGACLDCTTIDGHPTWHTHTGICPRMRDHAASCPQCGGDVWTTLLVCLAGSCRRRFFLSRRAGEHPLRLVIR